MRTTMDLDDDVLQAVKEIADLRRTTAGKALSDLVRKALAAPAGGPRIRNGVPLLPRRAHGSRIVTMAMVNELRDDD